MKDYFVVLELPGGEELKFDEVKGSPRNFWSNVASHIVNGTTRIICRRNDTGVSEELRKHLGTLKKFTTYLIFDLKLQEDELDSPRCILKKAASWLKNARHEMVVDSADNFQLVTIT